jgi:DNA polymerase-1
MPGKISILKDPSLNQGKSFELLEKVLYQICQVNPDNVTMFNIPPNINAFQSVQTDVILTVGEAALNYCCGLKGIMKYAGTVQKMGSIPVVPIVSPGYIEHNANYMRQWAEQIQLASNISMGIKQVEATNQFIIVKDLGTIEKVAQYCKETGYCSFDFETTDLTDLGTFDPDFMPLTISISFQPGSAYVIPLMHPEGPFADITLEEVVIRLRPIFCNPHITKIGQNVKFDLHCAAWLGIMDHRGPYHDTMLMHQLIDENMPHGLKPIVKEYYPRFANYEAEVGKNFSGVSLEVLAKYNALDSDLTLRHYWIFTNILLENPEIYLMYRNLTAPATKTLFHMEETGMLCNKQHLVESIRKVDEMILKQEKAMADHYEVTRFMLFKKEEARRNLIVGLEAKQEKVSLQGFKSKTAQENWVKRLADINQTLQDLKTGVKEVEAPEINFSSPAQLSELMFSVEGFGFVIPKQEYKRYKEDSTSADNISLIKDKTGFIDDLQAFRQLKQINSTYLGSILEKLDKDHYIHTTYNQHVTKTGRLSAKNPNLQNIISRTKFKIVEDAVALVKQAFISPSGYTLYQADYSQIELRIMAHYAQEHNMLEIYRQNKDIHEATAANSHGYKIEEFQKLKETDPALYKKLRFQAKAENFGYVYGMSANGFKEYARTDYNMDITLKDAEKRREAYFKKYPELLKYHKLYIDKARKFKYVRTFFGRRVHLPDIDSINSGVRGHAERNAINSPIQGSAGEMTIFALSLLQNRLPKEVLIVNSIHDSIMMYIPIGMEDEVLPNIKETMENLPLMQYFGKEIGSVPIIVEFESSKESWGDLV